MLKYGILNIGKYTELPQEITPVDISFTRGDFVKFGSDNIFPNLLAEIVDRSSYLGGALQSKLLFTKGNGIVDDRPINNDNETISDIFENVTNDYYEFGNAYIEIVKPSLSASLKLIALFHRDATTIRAGKNNYNNKLIICDDWSKLGNTEIIEKNKVTIISKYPEWSIIEGNYHSIYHIKNYHPRYKYYGLIGWVSGLGASEIAYKTDKWNISKLDNNYIPSGILTVGVDSQKEADELYDYYQKNEIGSGNNGKVMFIAVGKEGSSTTFSPLNQNVEGSWLTMKEATKEDIMAATNWFSILLGQSKAGTLGQTQEIRNVYNLAMKTIIKPVRTKLINIFNSLLDEELIITDITPFDYGDKIDFNQLLTKRQAFEMLDINYDENRSDLDQTISSGKSINIKTE